MRKCRRANQARSASPSVRHSEMDLLSVEPNNRTKMVLFIVDLSGKGNCDVGWSIVVKRIDTYENNVLKMLRDFQLFRECLIRRSRCIDFVPRFRQSL